MFSALLACKVLYIVYGKRSLGVNWEQNINIGV